MIIYQFHMLSNGEIKISKAEYIQAVSRDNKPYYKRIKTIEKGIKQPKFPLKLYKLGEYNYNKFHTDSMEDLEKFTNLKVERFEKQISGIENQLKLYKEIRDNLKKY